MKKLKLNIYEYKKVLTEDVEMNIPTETMYVFQTHIRRAIKIIPEIWACGETPHMKDGDVYTLTFTCVYQSSECKIEKFTVPVRQFQDYINHPTKHKTTEMGLVDMLFNEDYNTRSESEFNQDFESAMDKLRQ